MRWPWSKRAQRSTTYSVGDPAFASFLGVGNNYAGVDVNEGSALGLSAVWRAVSLIAGTIGSLPLRTVREVDGVRTQVASFLDNPGGQDGPTPLEWTETVFAHLLLHGDAFLYHVYNGGGAIAALQLLHPCAVSVRWVRQGEDPRPGGKVYTATLVDGQRVELDATKLTQISAMSTDGLRGMSVVSMARNSLGTAIAGDRAAARMFSNGALISGVVTAESGEDITPDEAKTIKDSLNRDVAGWDNAADIAVINKALKFTPWTMSSEDAQFLQSRVFQVEEIARWFGIPPHLLGQTEKTTSWGAGIEVQNRGLARTVLQPWARRVEQRLSRLLPAPRFVEFDFSQLERATPEAEVNLLIAQVGAGILTIDEARHRLNLPPMPVPSTVDLPDPEAVPA